MALSFSPGDTLTIKALCSQCGAPLDAGAAVLKELAEGPYMEVTIQPHICTR